MTINPEDFKSIDRKIGEIFGILSPIPDQLSLIFDKLNREHQERLESDASIRSDLRSLSEKTEQLKECSVIVESLKNKLHDIKRTFSIQDNGNSNWANDVELSLESIGCEINTIKTQINTIKTEVDVLEGDKTKTNSIVKYIIDKIVTIVVTLLIAYVSFKFGLS